MRIMHTMLWVTDLDRSVDFYTNILGMREIKRMDNPEY
ncbi:MAG: VOC family protein, partial [Pseudomonadales bacterium]|nr:VOC family protein [Pseudomonadales bacterium]